MQWCHQERADVRENIRCTVAHIGPDSAGLVHFLLLVYFLSLVHLSSLVHFPPLVRWIIPKRITLEENRTEPNVFSRTRVCLFGLHQSFHTCPNEAAQPRKQSGPFKVDYITVLSKVAPIFCWLSSPASSDTWSDISNPDSSNIDFLSTSMKVFMEIYENNPPVISGELIWLM